MKSIKNTKLSDLLNAGGSLSDIDFIRQLYSALMCNGTVSKDVVGDNRKEVKRLLNYKLSRIGKDDFEEALLLLGGISAKFDFIKGDLKIANTLANSEIKFSKPSDAIKRIDGLFAENPSAVNDKFLMVTYAKALLVNNEPQKAHDYIGPKIGQEQVLEQDKYAHQMYIQILLSMGEFDAAINHYQFLLVPNGLFKDDKKAHLQYASTLWINGETNKAERFMSRLLKRGNLLFNDDSGRDLYIKLLVCNDKVDLAKEKLNAIDDTSGSFLSKYLSAKIMFLEGDVAGCKKYLQPLVIGGEAHHDIAVLFIACLKGNKVLQDFTMSALGDERFKLYKTFADRLSQAKTEDMIGIFNEIERSSNHYYKTSRQNVVAAAVVENGAQSFDLT